MDFASSERRRMDPRRAVIVGLNGVTKLVGLRDVEVLVRDAWAPCHWRKCREIEPARPEDRAQY